MAWKRLDQVVEGVIRRAELQAEQAGAVGSATPAVRHGIGGVDQALEGDGRSTPMRGAEAGDPAQSETGKSREPKPPASDFGGSNALSARDVYANRCLPAEAFRRPIGRSEHPARAAGRHLVVVWDRDRHAVSP